MIGACIIRDPAPLDRSLSQISQGLAGKVQDYGVSTGHPAGR
jgi:hypothetical protein